MTYKLPVASHTFLNDWENCPHKAFRKFIAKDLPRTPSTGAMSKGVAVHKAFEVRLRGEPWPTGMEGYEKYAAPLIAADAQSEMDLGITEAGQPCDFFNQNVWLRGKLDATVLRYPVGVMFDWKTNAKRREDSAELKTHAIILKAHFPQVQQITGYYVWLEDGGRGRPHDVSDTETTLAGIRKTMDTVASCIEIEDFPKRRNPLCGYCPVMDCENNTVNR